MLLLLLNRAQNEREREDSEREGGVLEYADRIAKFFLVGLWKGES